MKKFYWTNLCGMENFQENKVFGDIFCRYLKIKFGWSYEAVNPQEIRIPKDYIDVDVVLISEKERRLYLQLKQPLEFEKLIKIMTKSSLKIFKNCPFEVTIQKVENNYNAKKEKKKINNIILLLHLHTKIGYLIPEDTIEIKKIQSNFKGIYVVSPKLNAWQGGKKKILKEFVFEIKKAF